jgi:uncharacterized protein (TIGR03083 family)
MPTIVDGPAIVTLLEEEFAAVEALCDPLAEDQWATATCLPGWSVRDNVSHMIGTESMLLQEQAPSVEVSSTEHIRNPIGEANEQWVESMRSVPGKALLDRFREVTGRRLDVLRAMTQADFDAPSWTPAGPDETYGRFMRIRHFDCFMHEHDIRAALGLGDRPDASHVRSALDEVATGLGFIVGKRAKMPSGTRVRLDLSGPFDQTYLVEVAERASVVTELSGPPNVTLAMPAMVFLRLTGGREPGAAHLGKDVTFEGDAELATALATNLAFAV